MNQSSSMPKAWVAGGVMAAMMASAGAMMAWRGSGAAQPDMPAAPMSSSPVTASAAATTPAPQHPAPRTAEAPVTPATPVAKVCHDCGVIESVQAVKRKGEGTGVGAVAGGVVGGLIGNQFGHGNGRAAMTVVGAVGGGLAGHEIEKQARATTVYQVRVRLDDGRTRTLEQSQMPQMGVGQRVRVEGHSLRALRSEG